MFKKSFVKFSRPVSFILSLVCIVILTAGSAIAEDFNFVSMADARGESTAINKPILDKIVALAAAAKPEFVLFEGDTVLGSKKDLNRFKAQLAEFKQAMKPLSDLCNIYYAAGNHECNGQAHQDLFRQTFNNPTSGPGGKYEGFAYSFDHKNSHFICLATNLFDENNILSNDQMKWLEGDLKMSMNAEHVFVIGHSPAYPVGSHIGSSLDKYPAQRDKFWALLNKYRVDAYFCGHEHTFDRQKVDNVFQIINGSCGAPLRTKIGRGGTENYSGSFFQYVLVNVSGPDVTFSIYDETNKLRDKFRLSRRVLNTMHSDE